MDRQGDRRWTDKRNAKRTDKRNAKRTDKRNGRWADKGTEDGQIRGRKIERQDDRIWTEKGAED